MIFKLSIKTLCILFLLNILLYNPVQSQTQFILDNEKSIIGIPIYIPNTDSIIVKKFDGTIDAIKKSNVVFENDVKISIITNQMNYINVKNLQILDSTYQFTFRAKDIILHKDSVIKLTEKITQKDIDSRNMIGVGLGFPYGLSLTYDKELMNNSGYRLNLNASVVTSFIFDYYININRTNNIEQNISFSGGLYVEGGNDFAHGKGPKLGFTIGSTYDLKIHLLMIRAGVIFAPTNNKSMLLPNLSVGLLFEI